MARIDLSSHRVHVACKILFATCLTIAIVALQSHWAVGQTIANPSFETPNLSPGDGIEAPTNAGWSFQPLTGIVAYTSDIFTVSQLQPIAPPPDGTQFAVLSDERSIQQTISGFTVGQAYRLDWFQGYGSTAASGGSAITARLEEPGGGATHTIAPLELANSPSLAARTSDVFVATSESYDLIIQNSDEVPSAYDSREALIDHFEFVAVNELATTRTSHTASLGLTSASTLEVDGRLGGVSLNADIISPIAGDLNVDFDIIDGEVANLHFNESQLILDSLMTGVIELGVLGSADVTITDGELLLFHEESSVMGQHRVSVDENGEFLLGSTFVEYDGEGEFALNGPIQSIVGDDSIVFDFGSTPAADLGITTLNDRTIFSGPGSIDLLPTGNPSEFLVTIGIPILIATPLEGEVAFDLEVSGFIEAQGIVVVPEPSGIALALLAVAFIGVSTVLRRRQFGVSSA